MIASRSLKMPIGRVWSSTTTVQPTRASESRAKASRTVVSGEQETASAAGSIAFTRSTNSPSAAVKVGRDKCKSVNV